MPTPRQGYTVDGEKVPSVTTILGRFKTSDELIGWAWRLGKEGKDFNVERDSAAAIGTCTHACIELTIAGEPIPPTIAVDNNVRACDMDKARFAFSSWLKWREENPFTADEQEVQLISKAHLFGGTFDIVGKDKDGKRTIYDWKTSARIYNTHLTQCLAYAVLWEETHPNEPIDQIAVIRLDKSAERYEQRIIERRSAEGLAHETAFLKMLELYRFMKASHMLYEKRK